MSEPKLQTLEGYLTEAHENFTIDHAVRCMIINGVVRIYIRPAGKDGRTMDFAVDGNTLKTL